MLTVPRCKCVCVLPYKQTGIPSRLCPHLVLDRLLQHHPYMNNLPCYSFEAQTAECVFTQFTEYCTIQDILTFSGSPHKYTTQGSCPNVQIMYHRTFKVSRECYSISDTALTFPEMFQVALSVTKSGNIASRDDVLCCIWPVTCRSSRNLTISTTEDIIQGLLLMSKSQMHNIMLTLFCLGLRPK